MTADAKKLENVFEQKRLECRADNIPCTVKSTYSNLDGKEDVLVRKELQLLDSKQVVIGVEFDTDGTPVEVYTQDAKGKRIKLTAEAPKRSSALPDLIEKRLNSASRVIEKKSPTKEDKSTSTENKKSSTQKLSVKDKNFLKRITEIEKRA